MNRYRIKVEATLEVDAQTPQQALDMARDEVAFVSHGHISRRLVRLRHYL